MHSREILRKWIHDGEHFTTDNPFHAIYVLRNGKMLDGEFYDNGRCIDHRSIGIIVDTNPYICNDFWLQVFQLGVIMLIPETKQIAYPTFIRPTAKQRKVINYLCENNYETLVDNSWFGIHS